MLHLEEIGPKILREPKSRRIISFFQAGRKIHSEKLRVQITASMQLIYARRMESHMWNFNGFTVDISPVDRKIFSKTRISSKRMTADLRFRPGAQIPMQYATICILRTSIYECLCLYTLSNFLTFSVSSNVQSKSFSDGTVAANRTIVLLPHVGSCRQKSLLIFHSVFAVRLICTDGPDRGPV